MAEEADALAHAGAVEVRGRGGDDVEVQDQVLGRDGVEVELPDGLAAEGNGGLEDGAGGDDGGDHDERLAKLPGGDLADIEGVAAADGEDDFGVGKALNQIFQVVLSHAALVLEGAWRMGQVWPRNGPGAGRGDGDVVGVLGRVRRQNSAAVTGVPGAAVEVHGEVSGGGVGNDTCGGRDRPTGGQVNLVRRADWGPCQRRSSKVRASRPHDSLAFDSRSRIRSRASPHSGRLHSKRRVTHLDSDGEGNLIPVTQRRSSVARQADLSRIATTWFFFWS